MQMIFRNFTFVAGTSLLQANESGDSGVLETVLKGPLGSFAKAGRFARGADCDCENCIAIHGANDIGGDGKPLIY